MDKVALLLLRTKIISLSLLFRCGRQCIIRVLSTSFFLLFTKPLQVYSPFPVDNTFVFFLVSFEIFFFLESSTVPRNSNLQWSDNMIFSFSLIYKTSFMPVPQLEQVKLWLVHVHACVCYTHK